MFEPNKQTEIDIAELESRVVVNVDKSIKGLHIDYSDSSTSDINIVDLPNSLPTITLSSPIGTVNGPVMLVGTAGDPDSWGSVVSLRYSIDGSAFTNFGTCGTNVVHFSLLMQVSNGSHVLTVEAMDNEGGVTSHSSIFVYNDDHASKIVGPASVRNGTVTSYAVQNGIPNDNLRLELYSYSGIAINSHAVIGAVTLDVSGNGNFNVPMPNTTLGVNQGTSYFLKATSLTSGVERTLNISTH